MKPLHDMNPWPSDLPPTESSYLRFVNIGDWDTTRREARVTYDILENTNADAAVLGRYEGVVRYMDGWSQRDVPMIRQYIANQPARGYQIWITNESIMEGIIR